MDDQNVNNPSETIQTVHQVVGPTFKDITPIWKKIIMVTVILVSMLVILFLAAGAYGNYKKAQLLNVKAALNEMAATGTIKADSFDYKHFGDYAPLLKLTVQYKNMIEDKMDAMEKELNEKDLAQLGHPQSMQSPEIMLKNISGMMMIRDKYRTEANQLFEDFCSQVIKSDYRSKRIKAGIQSGVDSSKKEQLDLIKRAFDTVELYQNEAKALYQFLVDKKGQYEVTEGKVLFYVQADLDAFQKHATEIDRLAQEAKKVEEEARKLQLVKLEKVNSLLH